MVHVVRVADRDDAGPIGQLLYDFNRESASPIGREEQAAP